ncbi:MAG TPA: 4-hydroxythreonine-4-phosphate dehydrogenase PdxA [Blastocatellia bacterium]|nr:4-hydroxythreonine-4-phosphate dehydrogenase PdxA [Blastocatellia bacterium]HAF22715.1 4-hydroxythreonine-4-phosphate dehydrogenase PdxA [Blastocatellia bacterium]HCX29495.1 4-hydroxythreonine-4-phosphate dehydrogenase PdxA [Blastocatellia bacterium]
MRQFANNASHSGPRHRRSLPRIAITMGDPAGIGPEVVLKAVAEEEIRRACVPVIIGDAQLLAHTARTLDLQCGYDIVRKGEPIPEHLPEPIIFHLDNINGIIEPGIESGAAGKAAGGYIEAAVELCAAGSVDAIATAPINKRSLFLGGYSFPGHTEFLAHLTGSEEYAMAFVAANLRIVLISTHVPLSEAIRLVERDRVMRTINLTNRELKRWGIEQPRLAVAALNPHGSEGGLFGMEEASEIMPAIEACRMDDIDVRGPFSADTVFLRASRGEFDAVVACYHDQAMIPVKCLSFGEAVNVTLGLPFIRTSVDHGTAFDIAGKGVAEHSSMIAAIKLAAELSMSAGESSSAVEV